MTAETRRQSPSLYIIAWAVLLTLLGASIFSAYLPLGRLQPAVQFAIAAAQAAIIFAVFMRLRGRPLLHWYFAGAGFFWLVFLYGLGLADYATRSVPPH